MQTHHYPSLLTCLRKSLAEEGLLGLYRGFLPPLMTTSAAKSLSFSVFEGTKQWLRDHDPLRGMRSIVPDFQRTTLGSVALTAALSGSVAGTTIAVMCCPLELVKIQMQLANLLKKEMEGAVKQTLGLTGKQSASPAWARSNLSVCREIFRQKGVLGLYSGLQLHI
ncbi:hypothetical protein EC988_009682, partial [Linderina pennispora]